MRGYRFTSDGPLTPTRPTAPRVPGGHTHSLPRMWSRRGFLQSAAGVTALGAAVGSGLLRPPAAAAAGPGIGLVEPIPTTAEFFPGVESHVQAPPDPNFGGPSADPATVYNFEGATGVGYISGTCERRNRKTGESADVAVRHERHAVHEGRLPGVATGTAAGRHSHSFKIDVYDPSSGVRSAQ